MEEVIDVEVPPAGGTSQSKPKDVRKPWSKLWNEMHSHPDVVGMPLSHQAIYFRLQAFANIDEPRGTFSAANRRKLARAVASRSDGPPDEEALTETLDYLVNDAEILRELGDDVYLFTDWEERQARYPSDEPDATRERQRRSRENKKQLAAAPLLSDHDAVTDVTSGHEWVTNGHGSHDIEEEGVGEG